MFYPTSLKNYGSQKLAAACLLLVLKIWGIDFQWCTYLSEITGFEKGKLKASAFKICNKYLGLVVNDDQRKNERM
jgi:hypothetical protein